MPTSTNAAAEPNDAGRKAERRARRREQQRARRAALSDAQRKELNARKREMYAQQRAQLLADKNDAELTDWEERRIRKTELEFQRHARPSQEQRADLVNKNRQVRCALPLAHKLAKRAHRRERYAGASKHDERVLQRESCLLAKQLSKVVLQCSTASDLQLQFELEAAANYLRERKNRIDLMIAKHSEANLEKLRADRQYLHDAVDNLHFCFRVFTTTL
jgi:hypothetical protein